ncbi:MAG TPA: RHS repeat-associated core domain-containing protein, partial [Roseiflexaceae bacterium]
ETTPLSQVLTYTYDTTGNLISSTDAAGVRTTYDYDSQNRRTAQTRDPDGLAVRTEYTYDLAGNLVKQIDDAGPGRSNVTTQHAYTPIDSDGNYAISRVTDPLGHQTSYTYTPAGQVSSVTDPLGHTTVLTYTAQGWQAGVTTPQGRTTLTTYTNDGQPLTVTDPSGNRTSVTYDAFGRRLQTKQGTVSTVNTMTAYAYDANSRVISTTVGFGTPLAQTSTYGYDSFGRVVTTTVGFGTLLARSDVTHYKPDNTIADTIRNFKDGAFDAARPDEDVVTTYGYDHMGRPVWVRDALGHYSATHYDVAGRIDWTVRNWTPFQLDGQDQPVYHAYQVAQPDANVATRYGFDRLGRTVLVTETGILTGTFDPATLRFSSAIERVTRTQFDTLNRPITTTLNYRPDLPVGTLADVNVQTITRYDAIGHATWQRDALGRWTHSEYDPIGRPVTVTVNYENGNPLTVDAANRAWTDGSDTDLISVSRYSADGQVDHQIDNYVDGVFSATAPITDRLTLYSYDTAGRPTTTTLNDAPGLPDPALNRASTVAYDPLTNRMAGQRDALGRWVSQQYDALGRVTATIQNCRDANGNAVAQGCAPFDGVNAPDRNVPTQTRYNVLGRAFEAVDPLGTVTHQTFDGLGRPTATTRNYLAGGPLDAATNVTTRQTYNSLGRTLTATAVVTGNVEATSQYAYTGLGQTAIMTDTMGRITRSGYDGRGALRWTQRPDGRITVSQVDGLGRVVATTQNYQDGLVAPTEPADQDLVTRTSYDLAGRRVRSMDAIGRATAFGYDLRDQLIWVQENVIAGGCDTLPAREQPCNVLTRYQYDRAGNRIAIIDARGNVRRFAYDAADQQIEATDALNRATSWDYDAGGGVTTQRDGRGITDTLTFGYDGLDRLTQTSAPSVGTIAAQYDGLGRRRSRTDGTGTTSFSYDSLGHLTQVQAPQTGTIGYGYDARGQRTRLTYPDGTALNYAYELDGQLHTVTQGSTTLADYQYDAAGRLAQVARANGATTTYSYDNADRPRDLRTTVGSTEVSRFQYSVDRLGERLAATETLAGQSRTIAYSYDGLLRLTGATESPGTTYAYSYDLAGNRTAVQVNGIVTESRSFDAANQVVGWTYDAAGNLTNDGTATYSYDALNRTQTVTSGSQTRSNTYNGDGMLLAQTANSATISYTQDLAAPLSQILQTTQAGATTSYLYGIDRLAAVNGTTRTWYQGDALSSVRQTLSDTGTPLSTVSYDPWGTPEAGTVLTFGFTGELQDAATGLVNLRARWYHATHGTFTSRDSFPGVVTRPASLHAYQYTGNDPVLYTDPSGYDYCFDIFNDPNCQRSQGINWEAGAAYGATVGRTAWETVNAPVTTLLSLTNPQTWETMRRGAEYLGAHPFRSAFYVWQASIAFYDDIYYGIKCDDSTRFAKGMTQLAVMLAGAKFQKDFFAARQTQRMLARAATEQRAWARSVVETGYWARRAEINTRLSRTLGRDLTPAEVQDVAQVVEHNDLQLPNTRRSALPREGITYAPIDESGLTIRAQNDLLDTAEDNSRFAVRPGRSDARLWDEIYRQKSGDIKDGMILYKYTDGRRVVYIKIETGYRLETVVSDIDLADVMVNDTWVKNEYTTAPGGLADRYVERAGVDHIQHGALTWGLTMDEVIRDLGQFDEATGTFRNPDRLVNFFKKEQVYVFEKNATHTGYIGKMPLLTYLDKYNAEALEAIRRSLPKEIWDEIIK